MSNRMAIGKTTAGAIAALTVATFAVAQSPQPQDLRIRDAILAEDLAARGAAEKDPVLLLAAARILMRIQAPESVEASGRTPTDLANRAIALAPQDATMAELAIRIERQRAKGLETGPLHVVRLIRPGTVDVQSDLRFEAGKEAEVYLHGDGSGGLEMEVRSATGQSMCRSDGRSDKVLCRFRPQGNDAYVVEVRNASAGGNRFRLLTN